MTMPAWLHRRGWIASPSLALSLAFRGVPFGPERRDLAGEVMAAIWADHDLAVCPVCTVPDAPHAAPELEVRPSWA